MNTQILTIAGMIIAATAASLIPHPPNFSPLAAIALFAGAHCSRKSTAFGIPLAILFLRDLAIGLHILMPFVYACYAFNVLLGLWLKRAPFRASIIGSCAFFIVTNFSVWLLLGTYPPTATGLFACYVAGLPYFVNTLLGDLFYAGLMFGLYSLFQRQFATQRQTA